MSNPNEGQRVAISGSYRTGKSTLLSAISELTRLPGIQPPEAPEIFARLFDGRDINGGSQEEFAQVGFQRFIDRVSSENVHRKTGFVADGTALTEFAYGVARQRFGHGAHGPGTPFASDEFRWAVKQLGAVATRHCREAYDSIIHLPVEFGLTGTNSEGIDEPFRREADRVVRQMFDRADIPYTIIGGSPDERVAKVISELGLSVLHGREIPRVDGDTVHYQNIDGILGPGQDRWFSDGFKRVNHNLHDIEINTAEGQISALLDLEYDGAWSTHDGEERPDVHLSSIDVILTLGQLAQAYMFTKDGIDREGSNNLWLREVQIKARRAVTSLTDIPFVAKVESCYPSRMGTTYHTATATVNVGGNCFTAKGKVSYLMPPQE